MILRRHGPHRTIEIDFLVPAALRTVSVVGDFNDWGAEPIPFRTCGEHRIATTTVRVGRRYRFRYTTADGAECNDDTADDYLQDPLGAHTGVLDLTAPAVWSGAATAAPGSTQ